MREIADGVLHWTAEHPNIHVEVSSYWLVPEGVVLNPLEPSEGLDAFAGDPPHAVLLTNRHHFRHSDRFAERFGAAIWAPTVGLHAFTPDQGVRGYDDGDEPVPGVVARAIGELSPDEYALIVPRAQAVAVADGVVKMGGDELCFVPDELIGDDPEAVKRGLRAAFARLAEDVDIELLLLAHGSPVVGRAGESLRAFIRDEG